MHRSPGSSRPIPLRHVGVCAAAALAVLLSGASRAHELGAVRARVHFSAAGNYRIDVRVDTEQLPRELRPVADASTPDAAERLRRFRARFVEQAQIAFDGTPVPLEPEPIGEGDGDGTGGSTSSPTQLLFRFGGTVPRGARSFTWSHAMAVGAYTLEIAEDGAGESHWEWLQGGQSSEPFALHHARPPLRPIEVVRQYLVLGYTHIVPYGLDHILFVIGLFLLSLRWRTILPQVTAFTVAHSITLGLTIYGLVSLSPRIVEPLIALSIVYVAVENLFVREARPARVVVVFCFGLLHGMGFAGVLRELGLPRSDFLTALVSFNVGVEAGQLSVIALAFAAVGFWFGEKPWYRKWLTVPASCAISLVGLYWTVERVFL